MCRQVPTAQHSPRYAYPRFSPPWLSSTAAEAQVCHSFPVPPPPLFSLVLPPASNEAGTPARSYFKRTLYLPRINCVLNTHGGLNQTSVFLAVFFWSPFCSFFTCRMFFFIFLLYINIVVISCCVLFLFVSCCVLLCCILLCALTGAAVGEGRIRELRQLGLIGGEKDEQGGRQVQPASR